MQFHTTNPSTGNLLYEYDYSDWSEIEKQISLSHQTYTIWSQSTIDQRIQSLLKLKSELECHFFELSNLMTTEMGKPISESEAEINKSYTLIDYFCQNGPKLLQTQNLDHSINSASNKAYVKYLPMGPILGIMPWNFPLWQIIRFAIPTLLLGNSVLIKHSENTTGSALLIEKIFKNSLGVGVYQNIVATLDDTAKIINDFRVRGVSLTGSVRAGREVASLAGRALKKVVLELGGSDPYIVLEDADLIKATEEIVKGRALNTGQSCISAKRIIVVDKVFNEFQEIILTRIKSLQMGDPKNRNYNLGPMARADLRYQLHDQVMRSISRGAKLIWGGAVPVGQGFYYPATLLTEVKPEMAAFEEELFGPVFTLIRARDESHAIELANQSEFGLGGAIFSKNIAHAEQIACNQINSGTVFVNEFVKSNPAFPFGGIKNSGVGREMGAWGMLEFANIKTIWVKKS